MVTNELEMNPTNSLEHHHHYRMVADAIGFLHRYRNEQPTLARLANEVGLSEFHLQRVFTDWAGVSPKQFLQFLTRQYALRQLDKSSVLDSALDSGLSGPGRLHDLMVKLVGATPGEIKAMGAGLNIEYGTTASPFGDCFIATTARGVCKLGFIDSTAEVQQQLKELSVEWPEAVLKANDNAARQIGSRIFASHKQASAADSKVTPLRLFVNGSPFQIKVWEGLLSIPQGDVVSYQDVASRINAPTATRAVASAIARNRVGWLIPCHRVIRQTGEFGNYRWHATRKQAMIAWEASQAAGS